MSLFDDIDIQVELLQNYIKASKLAAESEAFLTIYMRIILIVRIELLAYIITSLYIRYKNLFSIKTPERIAANIAKYKYELLNSMIIENYSIKNNIP